MIKRLLDAQGGVVSEFHYDEMEDRTIINRVQDAEPILENNKRLQAEDGYSPSRDLKRVASIPLVVWEKWNTETNGRLINGMGKQERDMFLKRKLQDPDNRFFLTSARGW